MKWAKCKLKIYPCTFYFCAGGNAKEIKAKLKRLKLTPALALTDDALDLGWTIKLTTHEGRTAILVWVLECKKTPDDISIVVHECTHGLFYLLDYIDQEMPNYKGAEFITYLLDFIVEQALNCYWK